MVQSWATGHGHVGQCQAAPAGESRSLSRWKCTAHPPPLPALLAIGRQAVRPAGYSPHECAALSGQCHPAERCLQ